jgi:hypothetical protein
MVVRVRRSAARVYIAISILRRDFNFADVILGSKIKMIDGV